MVSAFGMPGVNRQLSLRINHVLAEAVSPLHQGVQVVTGWMHFYPSGVVLWRGCFGVADCVQSALVVNLLVAPNSVCPHVCAVEVGFRGVKNHAVDGRLVAVLVVLDVLLDVPGGID